MVLKLSFALILTVADTPGGKGQEYVPTMESCCSRQGEWKCKPLCFTRHFLKHAGVTVRIRQFLGHE